jgi:hypothetical protein
MLRFKQFLLEYGLSDIFTGTNKAAEKSKNMRNPIRTDYSDDDAGQQAYLSALRSSADKQRQVGTEMTNTASGQANTLQNTESTLRTVKDVADTTLSVGAAVVPVVGPALNAAVKGIEGGLEAKDGNYLAAGIKAADAILPFAGKLVTPGLGVASNIGKSVIDPVKTVIGIGANKLGVNALATKATGAVVGSVAPNLGKVGTNLATKTVSKVGINQTVNAVANKTNDVVKPLIDDAKETQSDILTSYSKNNDRKSGTLDRAKI